jgi:protein-L-isoaspartate O-methyltransferase
MGSSVLVIGAGGNFGSAVMNEFIRQKSSFSRVGILTDPARKGQLTQFKGHGIDFVLGSYFGPEYIKVSCWKEALTKGQLC